MKVIKGIILYILFLSFMQQGCATCGPGAREVNISYAEGELQVTYIANFDRVWEASLSAIKDLEIAAYKTERDATGGLIEARRSDGTNVKLTSKPTAADSTFVTIKVGVLGDEEASNAIRRQISNRLWRR